MLGPIMDDIKNKGTRPASEITWLIASYPKVFETLLIDHSSNENIYWASDNYENLGEGFKFFDSITVDKIKGNIIQPRTLRSENEQKRRTQEKGEVFTPSWVCNAQNNLVDDVWFGRKEVFNIETTDELSGRHTWYISKRPILFEHHENSKSRSFENYVKDRRLEITCGEAPYLVSRYDVVTGEKIDVERRIGMLDRKLQVISQEIQEPNEWLNWAREAIKSVYGFEWQGDNLLLARVSILLTIIDYFKAKFPDEPGNIIRKNSFITRIKNIAHFISCNLWQMDGLNYVLPGTAADKPYQPNGLFGEEEIENSRNEAPMILKSLRKGEPLPLGFQGIPAIVYDWWDKNGKSKKEKQFFASIVKN